MRLLVFCCCCFVFVVVVVCVGVDFFGFFLGGGSSCLYSAVSLTRVREWNYLPLALLLSLLL